MPALKQAIQPAGFLRFSRQELVLIIVTAVWGGTFLVVQHALTVSGPLLFVGCRFAMAAFFTLCLSGHVLTGFTRREMAAGTLIGVAIFAGYALQTLGLQTIPSSKSAFITAMYVPIVPLLQWVALRRPPRLTSWLGIAFAFAGLLLLAGPQAGLLTFGDGELYTLAGAGGIAVEIILISHFAGTVDIRRVTIIQLLVAALLAFTAVPATGEALPDFSWLLVLIAGAMGLASALIQLAMNWAQKSISPTRATVIYAAEPVWGGVFGRLAGERLPALAFVGAALVVVGVIVSEMKFGRKDRD